MAIHYVKGTRKLAFKEGKPTVAVLKPVRFPNITSEELVTEIAATQGVTRAQAKGVLEAYIDRLVHYMEIGHGVQMGEFGIFKVTFSAKSADDAEKLGVDSIKSRKILFTPGRAFRKMLKGLAVVSLDEGEVAATETPSEDNPTEPTPTGGELEG